MLKNELYNRVSTYLALSGAVYGIYILHVDTC